MENAAGVEADEKQQPQPEVVDNEDECDFAKMPERPPPPPAPEPEHMSLLPPDHPLLARFQQMLKEHLLRTKEQLVNDIAEMKYHLKNKIQQREEQGAKLYDMQQEISHQSEQLEEYADSIQEQIQQRQKKEAEVVAVRTELEQQNNLCKEQKTLYNKRMVELEHMNMLYGNIRRWADEVEDEVKNAKRIVNRDVQLQRYLSEEKKKADMLFYHLNTEVNKKEIEAQIVRDELKETYEVKEVLQMSLAQSSTDLEALHSEHKRLTQAWGEVIVAINHRDKILFEVNKAMEKEKEFVKLNVGSIEAVKKQTAKAIFENEKMTSFKIRLNNDFIVLKRDLQRESEFLAILEGKLETLPRLFKQTEKDLKADNKERTQLSVEINHIQYKINKQYNKKYEIEENILKLAQEQLITDKASQYRLKLLTEAKDSRRNVELTLSQTQSQLSEVMLEMERYKGLLNNMNIENNELNNKLYAMESKADHLVVEMRQLELQIDQKMKRMDVLSTQLDELINKKDGNESSTTESKIKEFELSIQDAEQQVREHQQFWLVLQNHYVNLMHKRDDQLNEIEVTRKQLVIIQQKSLKIDHDLEKSEVATEELAREIKVYTLKVQMLNEKMSKKRQQHEMNEDECEQEHLELLDRLKANEMKVLNIESEINELQTDVEHYKDLVLDKHRESLTWETKYKLIEEALRWRKSEKTLESEIGLMKTEIHRMTIRYSQLSRAQEKLLLDMQHCVMHREQIFTLASNRKRVESKVQRSKAVTTSQQKVNDLRNKLKQIQSEISLLTDQQLVEATHEYEHLLNDIKKCRQQTEEEEREAELLRTEIEEGFVLKHYNLENIVRKQNRAKAYRRLCHSSIVPPKTARSETSIQGSMQKQTDINDNLIDIIQKLTNDFPERKQFFNKISQMLKE